MSTVFLQLALEILQLPIILLIVIFCHRTSGVLKFPQMNFIAVAFGLNFIYMLLNILHSVITRMFLSGRIYELDMPYLMELVDLATFSFFPITCYYFFNQENPMKSERYPFKTIYRASLSYKIPNVLGIWTNPRLLFKLFS